MNVTMEQIQARCEEVGDCWMWQGATSDTGYPIMKRYGGPCMFVRRVVMQLKGKPPAAAISAHFGWSAPSACCDHIKALKRHGLIERNAVGKLRFAREAQGERA